MYGGKEKACLIYSDLMGESVMIESGMSILMRLNIDEKVKEEAMRRHLADTFGLWRDDEPVDEEHTTGPIGQSGCDEKY